MTLHNESFQCSCTNRLMYGDFSSEKRKKFAFLCNSLRLSLLSFLDLVYKLFSVLYGDTVSLFLIFLTSQNWYRFKLA